MRIILTALAQLASASLPAAAQEGGLSVETMIFCTGIEDRLPVGENTQFFESVERV